MRCSRLTFLIICIMQWLFLATTAAGSNAVLARTKQVDCYGNTETFDRQVVQSGVKYLMSYSIDGKQGKVRIAGRELEVVVDRGSNWKGPC